MPRTKESEFERSSEHKPVPVRKADTTSRRIPLERDEALLFPRRKRIRSDDDATR